MKTLQNSYK